VRIITRLEEMTLTRAPSIPSNPDNFPTVQLPYSSTLHLGYVLSLYPSNTPIYQTHREADISVAICRVAEPIALASCFPYAWVMVKDFHVGDKNSSSFYAGIFISAFALAEA